MAVQSDCPLLGGFIERSSSGRTVRGFGASERHGVSLCSGLVVVLPLFGDSFLVLPSQGWARALSDVLTVVVSGGGRRCVGKGLRLCCRTQGESGVSEGCGALPVHSPLLWALGLSTALQVTYSPHLVFFPSTPQLSNIKKPSI